MTTRDSIDRAGRLMAEARELLPYENLDSILQRPLYYAEDQAFPHFVQRAEGYELEDINGRTYIDWVHGGGPVLLGYRHPDVEAAIHEQLACGPTVSMMHPVEIDVARKLVDMIPCAEMASFGKNGSDGLTGAVRTARTVTGRDVVLQYGMHGFHDWYVCQEPGVRGLPAFLRELVEAFPYGDLAALEQLFERHAGRVAAVVMEPVREILPEPGYVEAVKDLAHRHGALLIFDEVVTAFRLGNGGGQAFVGVEPDLACLGKAMANGLPISALVGKREYMRVAASVAFRMTWRGETVSLAAARAALTVMQNEPVAEHIATIGERVRADFAQACERHRVRSRLSGPPARMTFGFEDQGGQSWKGLQDLFVQECLKQGVFTNGNILPNYAHDDAAVERTAEAFDAALAVVAAAVHDDSPSAPRAMIAKGFVESVARGADEVAVSGWMILAEVTPDRIEAALPDGRIVPADHVERTDVAEAYPAVAGAERAGFVLRWTPAEPVDDAKGLEFTLRAWCGERLAFLCRVVHAEDAWSSARWVGDGIIHA